MKADELIEKLRLKAHPEGGYYRETYRSAKQLDLGNNKERNAITAIYYLLRENEKSHFHRIGSDEVWLFHQGETLEISIIHSSGQLEVKHLGSCFDFGEELQLIVPANVWFAAQLKSGKGFALVSCIVAPGFDFSDFELAEKNELLKQYPHLKAEIEALCL